VEKYPEPGVLLDNFGDSSVNFRCLIWTNDIDNWLKIKSELSTGIYNALNEANITIPFPQRDLHVISWPGNPSSEDAPSTDTGANNSQEAPKTPDPSTDDPSQDSNHKS